MIPESFIQDLLARTDIVDIISETVRLKKRGANHLSCCPFHKEKTPSFTVSQTKQFYYCFGCGVNGSAIGFMMEYHGMSFTDAVQHLATRLGLPVPHAQNEINNTPNSRNLIDALGQATLFYHEQLKSNPEALAYAEKRGLTHATLEQFGIGYAPGDWQSLRQIFPDYSSRDLDTAGLVIDGENGKRYDRFRDRLMFPIVNQSGDIIGFGGRVLTAGGSPKYINSPQTPLFDKSHELYGLHDASQSIRKEKSVYVVEGYMDVVSMHQSGVINAVATLGTATTHFHLMKLFRLADRIVFCFDGDRAGRAAAWKAAERSLESLNDDKSIAFMFLPEEHDPDSYIKAHGKENFDATAQAAVSFGSFLTDHLKAEYDASTTEGRAALSSYAKTLIERVGAPMMRLQLINEVARLAQCAPADLANAYNLRDDTPNVLPAPEMRKAWRDPKAPITPLHEIITLKSEIIPPLRTLLALTLSYPDLSLSIEDGLLKDGDPEAAAVLAIRNARQSDTILDGATTAAVLEAMRYSSHMSAIEQAFKLSLDMTDDPETCQRLFADIVSGFQQSDDQQLSILEQNLDAGTATDEDKQRYRLLITKLTNRA